MNVLERLGLSSHEATIYTALLRLGPASARLVSDSTKIKRPTVYFSLDQLAARGLAIRNIIRGKKTYSAADPSVLKTLLRHERTVLEQREQLLAGVMEKLKKLEKTEVGGSAVRIYEGRVSLWKLADELLRKRQDMLFVYSGDSLLRHTSAREILKRFTTRRRQYGGSKLYAITDRNPISEFRHRQGDTDYREIRFFKKRADFDSIFCIVGSTVVLVSLAGTPRAVVMEDKSIVCVLAYLFWALWHALT